MQSAFSAEGTSVWPTTADGRVSAEQTADERIEKMDPKKDARTPRPLKCLALATGAGLLIVIAALAVVVPPLVRRVPEPSYPEDFLIVSEEPKELPDPSIVTPSSPTQEAEPTAGDPGSVRQIAQSLYRIPDLTDLREDLRPKAREWNRAVDHVTSSLLTLSSESEHMTYSEAKSQWERIMIAYWRVHWECTQTIPPREDYFWDPVDPVQDGPRPPVTPIRDFATRLRLKMALQPGQWRRPVIQLPPGQDGFWHLVQGGPHPPLGGPFGVDPTVTPILAVPIRGFATKVRLKMALQHGQWREAGDCHYELGHWDAAVYYYRKCGWEGQWIIADLAKDEWLAGVIFPVYLVWQEQSGVWEELEEGRREIEARRREIWRDAGESAPDEDKAREDPSVSNRTD
jgi:hypothetical protein